MKPRKVYINHHHAKSNLTYESDSVQNVLCHNNFFVNSIVNSNVGSGCKMDCSYKLLLQPAHENYF